MEGSHCPLADFGHNRDGKRGKQQVPSRVYRGNTGDPDTVADQCAKLQRECRLSHVVLAGDRGMLTSARIRDLQCLGGIDWISCLRSADIQKLASSGVAARSLFN